MPGYDWEAEKRNFWNGRADVAMGMLPLTLLGLGRASLKDIHGAQEMLAQDQVLARGNGVMARGNGVREGNGVRKRGQGATFDKTDNSQGTIYNLSIVAP